MKKYMLLIVLTSFVSQLQAAAGDQYHDWILVKDRGIATMALVNLSPHVVTVHYTDGGVKEEIGLNSGDHHKVTPNFVNEVSDLSVTYEGQWIPGVTKIDQWEEGQKYSDYKHRALYFDVGVTGLTYQMAPDATYYVAEGIAGAFQGLANFANYLSGQKR